MKDYGNAWIKDALDFKNLTVKELADNIGVSPTTIYRYINGDCAIPIAKLSLIKEELDILDDDDPDPRTNLPKAPVRDPEYMGGIQEYNTGWLCPNCESDLEWDGEDEETFCKECWQLLDWTEALEGGVT